MWYVVFQTIISCAFNTRGKGKTFMETLGVGAHDLRHMPLFFKAAWVHWNVRKGMYGKWHLLWKIWELCHILEGGCWGFA